MHILEGKVRLGGSLLHEVWKPEMTAPEVIVLRDIHGQDAIVDLEVLPAKKVEHAKERDRLGRLYGDARIERLFGPLHHPLPTEVPGVVAAARRRERKERDTPSIEDIAE